jgi:zinc transport system permease protein
VSRGFTATLVGAMALGVLASAGGLWTSWRIDSAPGATIVLVAIAGFVVVTLGVGLRGRMRRLGGGLAFARPAQSRRRLGPAQSRHRLETDPADPPEVVLDR